MPYYDFECANNECSPFEVKHGYDEPHPTICPRCGSPIRQRYSSISFKFKDGSPSGGNGHRKVRGESGAMGHLVSETDASNIDEETPTRIGEKGRPKMTPTRPLPAAVKRQLKAREIIDEKQPDGMTKRTHIF